MWPMYSTSTHFFSGEQEADEVSAGSLGWTCGGQCRVEWLLANEELEVLEEEGVVISVGDALEVLYWPD